MLHCNLVIWAAYSRKHKSGSILAKFSLRNDNQSNSLQIQCTQKIPNFMEKVHKFTRWNIQTFGPPNVTLPLLTLFCMSVDTVLPSSYWSFIDTLCELTTWWSLPPFLRVLPIDNVKNLDKTSHWNPPVSQSLQLLPHTVHARPTNRTISIFQRKIHLPSYKSNRKISLVILIHT